MILNKPASAMSTTARFATKNASQNGRTGETSVQDDSDMHHTSKRDQTMSRLAATRQLERELAERSERIRIRNLYVYFLLASSWTHTNIAVIHNTGSNVYHRAACLSCYHSHPCSAVGNLNGADLHLLKIMLHRTCCFMLWK